MTDPVQHTYAKPPAKRGCNEFEEDLSSEATEIKNLLLTLTKKIDVLNGTVSDNNTQLNTKIDNLEATVSTKIKDVKEEMEIRIDTVTKDLNQQVEKSKWECERRNSEVLKEISIHESRLDRLERFSLDKDLIISGVPLENNDDPFALLGDIIGALNCNLKQGDFVAVFRLRGNNSESSRNKRIVPIVARLQEEWHKQELLTAYFKKRNLNLTDIGFKTSTRIFINERLTVTNREIFNRASEAKRSNLIYRFFTRRGLVFIQRNESSRPECIYHVKDLQAILPVDSSRSNFHNVHVPGDLHSNQNRDGKPNMKTSEQTQGQESSTTTSTANNNPKGKQHTTNH